MTNYVELVRQLNRETAAKGNLQEIVQQLKAVPNNKSVDIKFPIVVGKIYVRQFERLLDDIYINGDVEVKHTIKKGMLQDTFEVEFGGSAGPVKQAFSRVLKAIVAVMQSKETAAYNRPVKIGSAADKNNVEPQVYQILKNHYGANFSREANLRKKTEAFTAFLDEIEKRLDVDFSKGLGKALLKTAHNFREVVDAVEALVAKKGNGA